MTLAVDYYCYNGSGWWHPSGTVASGTVEIKLAVTAKENGLAIENHIPENGHAKAGLAGCCVQCCAGSLCVDQGILPYL